MKIEDNHYTYRIETKDSNGGSLDFIDIDTVEPLRCAYDVQDELNLETNEHIKRVEEIVLDANSTEFWYVDEVRTSDTHLVCYFEEVELMASKDHPMVDTNRSVFEYGKINSNEHQNTNFICTHVMDNGVSRLYMSIDKTIFEFATFNNETIKHFISNNPVTVWYALRYEIIIPRSMSKGHLLTLSGQTDITLTTTSEQNKLPIMKFNIGDTQYTLDNNPIHINNTQEGTQIRNIVLEGNTPINYARGNGVNTTEQVSNTRYDFEPFYDGQATIQGTVEGGYVSAKLYGDTMVNIAKPCGETPLLTATNESALCDDLLGMNEEGIVLADGEITEGRIYGDSFRLDTPVFQQGYGLSVEDGSLGSDHSSEYYTDLLPVPINPFTFGYGYEDSSASQMYAKVVFYDKDGNFISGFTNGSELKILDITSIPTNATQVRYGMAYSNEYPLWKYKDGTDVYDTIRSVVNPNIKIVNNNLIDPSLFTQKINIALTDGGVMVDGDISVGWQSFYNNTTAIKLLANHTYKLRVFLLEGEYTGGNLRYTLSNNTAKEAPYTDTFTITPTIDVYLTTLSFYAPKGIGAKFGISLIETSNDLDTYIPYKSSQATFPYTLNKLPNGVADYIDVVNKVHVQRVGVLSDLRNNLTGWYRHSESTSEMFVAASYKGGFPIEYIGMTDKIFTPRMSVKEPYSIYVTGDAFIITIPQSDLTEDSISAFGNKLAEINPTVLYKMKTPIYTPLTEEEIAQLPLSAYKDGYVNLSSDQLMPSFEFRMRASNRYQVDMLETGYYYLNAPTGNVKLGTANVDVQQMPCIVKVDNVGTGNSGYRLITSATSETYCLNLPLDFESGYLNISNGNIVTDSSASGRWASDFIEIPYYDKKIYIVNKCEGVDLVYYDENKSFIGGVALGNVDKSKECWLTSNTSAKYMRMSGKNDEMVIQLRELPITLAKLPSHRIPTSFTQGMKCGIDFGCWQGIKVATGRQLYVNETNKLDFAPIELNRIEDGNTIVEDEFDIATGKLTKRIGKIEIKDITINDVTNSSNLTNTLGISLKNVICKNYRTMKCNILKNIGSGWSDDEEGIGGAGISNHSINLRINKNKLTSLDSIGVLKYLQDNNAIVYYELPVPEISYVNLSSNQVKTVANSTLLQSWRDGITYLNPQVKPSHLTYPVPSLIGNRTYTVVHNRKNITGSTKPIELNLGGTVVQLNDASSKTLVKTPSTLAHSNLIFIGGESTVDHIMVLDGDWTNKPIEYFENMMGHDTDAIITIIGNGQIDDVEEQYLW